MFNIFMTSPRKRSDASQSHRPFTRAHEPFYASLLQYMDELQRLTGTSYANINNVNFFNNIILEIRCDIDNALAAQALQPFRIYKLAELLLLIDGRNVLDKSRDVIVNIYDHILTDLFGAEHCHFFYQLSCDLVTTLLRDKFSPWQETSPENAAKLVWRLLFGLDDVAGNTFLSEHHEIIACLQSQVWFQGFLPTPQEMQAFCSNILDRPWTFALLTPEQLNSIFLPPPDAQWDDEAIMQHGGSIVKRLLANLNYAKRLLNEAAIQQSSVIKLFLQNPALLQSLDCKALAVLFVNADAQEGFRASTPFCLMLRHLTQGIITGDMENITTVPYLLYELAVYRYLYTTEMPPLRRQALLSIVGANTVLETLQFLDPNDKAHTRPEQFVFVDSNDNKLRKELRKTTVEDFSKMNELLLSDETLVLRQQWAKQVPSQRLFIQYPHLLKDVSSDDINAMPHEMLGMMAERAMQYRSIYNIFLSYQLLLAFLNVESLTMLYYQNENIKALVDEMKLSKEVIQAFIENGFMEVLAERIPVFARYLQPHYLTDILRGHASRRLLLAFLSNKFTQQTFMRYPSLLQFFSAEDLSCGVTLSSFLRQCMKQRDLLAWMTKNHDVLRQSPILDKLLSSLYKSDESAAVVKLFYPDCAHPASKLCLTHLNYDISLEMIATCIRAFPTQSHMLIASQGLTATEKQSFLPIFEKILIPYGSLQILEIYLCCLKQSLNGETISALLSSHFIAAQVLLMFENVNTKQPLAFNKSTVMSKLIQWATLTIELSEFVEKIFNIFQTQCKTSLAYLLLDTLYRAIVRVENIRGINFDLLCTARKMKLPLLTLIENLFGCERKQMLIASTITIAVDEHKQVAELPKYEKVEKATDEQQIMQTALIAEFGEVFEGLNGADQFKVSDLSLPRASYKPVFKQQSSAARVPHGISTPTLRDLIKDSLSGPRSKDKSKSKQKRDKHENGKDKKSKAEKEIAASSPANHHKTTSENKAAIRASVLTKWEAQKLRLEALKNEKRACQVQQSPAQQVHGATQLAYTQSVTELPVANVVFKRERRNTVSGCSLVSISNDATFKTEQVQLRKEIDERKQKMSTFNSHSPLAVSVRAGTAEAKKIQAREERLRELEHNFLSQSQLCLQQSTSASGITTIRPRRNTMTNVIATLVERPLALQQTATTTSEISTADVINQAVTSHATQTMTSNNVAAPPTRQRRFSVSETSSGTFFAASRPVNSSLHEVKGTFGRIEVKATGAQESVKDMAKKHTEERQRRASFSETRNAYNK